MDQFGPNFCVGQLHSGGKFNIWGTSLYPDSKFGSSHQTPSEMAQIRILKCKVDENEILMVMYIRLSMMIILYLFLFLFFCNGLNIRCLANFEGVLSLTQIYYSSI